MEIKRPPNMTLDPLEYNPRKREITATAFRDHSEITLPAKIDRDTGDVHLFSPAASLKKQPEGMHEAGFITRPGGEEYL